MQDTVQVIVYEKFNAINFDRLNSTPLEGVQVLPVTESWLPALLDYDESVVGHRREALLRLCLFEPESFGVLALQDSPPHSIQPAKVIGYGHVRLDNADKLMCGPLYASGQEVAERIMHRLLQDTPFAYNGLTLMVPDCVPNGHVIPDKLGLPALYWLPRLFTRHLPVARFEHIYGIHSPNFYPF